MNDSTLNWQTWLVQGDQYLKAAKPKGERSKFKSEILYNLLSMSMESYVMALLDIKKSLPDNHTYTDLMNALQGVMVIDQELIDRILKFENIQSICSIDKFHINAPTEEEIHELREAIIELGQIAHNTCAA